MVRESQSYAAHRAAATEERLQVWNFEGGIPDGDQFPIPRPGRSAFPFEFERRFERVHPVLDGIRELTAAFDCDPGSPGTAAIAGLNRSNLGFDPRIRQGTENFAQPFQ